MTQDGIGRLLQIQLLGGFQISIGDRLNIATELRLRAARQMIKLLALAPNYQLHREQILAILWPEQEQRAAVNSLNQALSIARRTLAIPSESAAHILTLRDQILCLGDPDLVWVDAIAFGKAVRAVLQNKDADTGLVALDLYQGDLLPNDPYDAWLDTHRAMLHQSFRALVLALGEWVKDRPAAERVITAIQQALANDPTDEELHRALMRLYATVGTRQQALRQYEQLTRAIRNELQLEPDPLSQELYRELLTGQFAATTLPISPRIALFAPRHNLPNDFIRFVGRAREVAEVRQLLTKTRLLTIAGAGGSGKTRLAVEVARGELESYADGVWLVEFAALTNPELLVITTASALGLRETQGIPIADQLLSYLANRRLLLLFDNCEHVIDACAHLAEMLLRHCIGLRILATSREPLHVGAEMTWLIPALSLPNPHQPTPTLAEVLRYEAFQLFVDRAMAAQAQFTLREQDIPALVQIGVRLDGLPLAIELAASRVPTLTLDQIAVRLDDRFRLLRSGSRTALTRQQTLRAAIDWSYDLLNEQERRIFRRLVVFSGGWELEAAEAICAGDGLETADVLPLLAQLVDKSLIVVRDTSAGRRYDLLESIREYGLEQLRAAQEVDELSHRHQAWYLQLAELGESQLTGPHQVSWLHRLAAEHDNFRMALQWAKTATREDVPWLRLAYRLYWFWYLHSAVAEGRTVFERALAQTNANDTSWVRGIALFGSGSMALYQGELDTARSRLDASLPLLRASDDLFSQALAPFMAGTVAVNQGDYSAALDLLEESLPHFEALGHRQGVATCLLHLGDVALGCDDPDKAEMYYRRCLAIHRTDTSSIWGMAQALNNLGEVARYRGDLAAAANSYQEALGLFRQLATRADVARTLHNNAALALAKGDTVGAGSGFRESVELFRAWGNCRGIVECIAGFAQLRLMLATDTTDWECVAPILGFVAAYFTRMGAAMWPPDRKAFVRAIAVLAEHLNDDLHTAAWACGQNMTLEQALAMAYSCDTPEWRENKMIISP